MTGYQEVLTDPSYEGQLVTFTYPELGNTGVNSDDQEADSPHARGVIARQLAPRFSNWRGQASLESWMDDHQLVVFVASIRAPLFAISVIAVQ